MLRGSKTLYDAVLLFAVRLSEPRRCVTASANRVSIVNEVWGFHEGRDVGLPVCDTVHCYTAIMF